MPELVEILEYFNALFFPDPMVKCSIAVLGSGGVGKSAITVQFVQGVFVDKYDPTVEESYTKQFEVKGQPVTLEIMDTAGSEVLTAMRDLYMKKADGFLLVYSIVMKSSFLDLQEIIEQLFRVKETEEVPIMIVGNKCDMDPERQVSRAEGEQFAALYGNCTFIETSAKECINVTETFDVLVNKILAKSDGQTETASKKKDNCLIS